MRTFARLRGDDGFALILVMGFVSLLFITVISLATMIARDIRLIKRAVQSEQARAIAAAGVNHALAKLKSGGFGARADFEDSLDTGSYSVAFTESGGRHLVTSTATVGDTTAVSSAEVADNTPTAMDYITAAGNNIKVRSFIAAAVVNGGIHANNDVSLISGGLLAFLYITGNVSAGNDVVEGTDHYTGDWYDGRIYINGVNSDGAIIYEDQPPVTFPVLDLSVYKQAAIDSGDYYGASLDVTDQSWTPTNGIVYVDGDLTLQGNCTINGGLIANNIYVRGTLVQNEAGTRNVVYAKNGDVRVWGRLDVGKALVYASQDIRCLQALAILNIDGVMIAKRDITFWDFLVYITYDHAPVSPADMLREDGEDMFKLVSWND